MTCYKVIQSGECDGHVINTKDKYLFASQTVPTLHFYRFESPTVSYGHNVDPDEILDVDALDRLNIVHGARNTPGGAVYHMWVYVFTVIVPLDYLPFASNLPNSLVPAYAFKYFNNLLREALSGFNEFTTSVDFISDGLMNHEGALESLKDVKFCMGNPTRHDIMKKGRKVCGAAEIISEKNLLHHGMVSLCPPDIDLLKKTLKNPMIADKMLERSFFFSDLSYKNKVALRLLEAKIEKAIFETFSKYPLIKQDLVPTP